MSFFKPKPFSKFLYFRSNTQWLLQHIFRVSPSKNLKDDLVQSLEKSGYKSSYIDIDRVENLSRKEFFSKYYNKNKPVILSGAAKNWPCMNWSFDFFSNKYPDFDTINTNMGALNVIGMAEAIEEIKSNKSTKARHSKILTTHKELLKETKFEELKKFIPRFCFTTSHQLFFGAKGNFTPLHAGGTNNYQIQITGEKTWHLIDPIFNPIINPIIDGEPLFKSNMRTDIIDLEKYPEQKYLPIIKAHMKPGDILFNPTFYWHQVQYNSESISIGLRSFSLMAMLRSSITMFLVLATATNPPAILSFLYIYRGKTRPFYK